MIFGYDRDMYIYNLHSESHMTNCKNCNVEFEKNDPRRKFCSSSCSAIYNNKIRVKKQYETADGQCIVCESSLKRYHAKFCSRICAGLHRTNLIRIDIESGKQVSVKCLRQYLLDTREHKCEICNGTKWLKNPMPLIMDHINGNPSDDSLSNLRLICPNCDRFLPTFGSRNLGRGRKSRGMKRM